MSKLQIAFCAWMALQLPMAMIVGRMLRQPSFDRGPHPQVERAGTHGKPPFLCCAGANYSNGCQKNQTAPAITSTAIPNQSAGEFM